MFSTSSRRYLILLRKVIRSYLASVKNNDFMFTYDMNKNIKETSNPIKDNASFCSMALSKTVKCF